MDIICNMIDKRREHKLYTKINIFEFDFSAIHSKNERGERMRKWNRVINKALSIDNHSEKKQWFTLNMSALIFRFSHKHEFFIRVPISVPIGFRIYSEVFDAYTINLTHYYSVQRICICLYG